LGCLLNFKDIHLSDTFMDLSKWPALWRCPKN